MSVPAARARTVPPVPAAAVATTAPVQLVTQDQTASWVGTTR